MAELAHKGLRTIRVFALEQPFMIIIGDERLHTEFLGYCHKGRKPIEFCLCDGTHAKLHMCSKGINKCSNKATLAHNDKQTRIILDVLSVSLSVSVLFGQRYL
jgi:hypothetical protein